MVDEDLATFGYSDERIVYLNVNHCVSLKYTRLVSVMVASLFDSVGVR